MAASWKPNFAIDLILKRKQKKFPDTIYVRDMQRAVVSGWDLRDHSYHIVALDREGRLIFEAAGEPSATQIGQLIAVIWDRIKD
jgi:predicted transcriptional regulator